MDLKKLKFPIGQYSSNRDPSTDELEKWIMQIDAFPAIIYNLVQDLNPAQLKWKYRPDGWMIKQVVHHCADSHMNAYIRFKLALTEDAPVIRPYFEDKWADLPDSTTDNMIDSLSIIKAIHGKWAHLLRSMSSTDLHRIFVHPEHGQSFTLFESIGNYAWHCNHHLGHIKNALASKEKFR